MSVIAVKITEKEIVIGADTQTTHGYYMKSDKTQGGQAMGKIYNFGDTILGSVGSAMTLQLFCLFLETNKLKNGTEREIVRLFKEFETWMKKEADSNYRLCNNHFFVVADKKVFLFNDYYVKEIHDFWSIGSGSIWALPALELGATVKKAVEVACKFDLYCSGEPEIIKVNK